MSCCALDLLGHDRIAVTVELRQLQSLIAIAEERHFTRAAQRLHIAQPALSQQLRRLEAQLGLRLVERTTRTVTLTDAGHALVARARRIEAELEAARSELDDLRGLRAGTVTIGISRATRSFSLAEYLAEFSTAAPGVELVVREELNAAVTRAILDDQVDLGIITPLDDLTGLGLTARTLTSERLVAIVPAGHPLARRRRVRLVDLAHEPLVAFPPEAVIRQRLEREAALQGVALHTAFEVTEVARLRSFVSAGLGVSVLPASDAAAPGDPVHVVPITGRHLTHRVIAAHRADRHHGPAVRAALDALDRHVTGRSG